MEPFKVKSGSNQRKQADKKRLNTRHGEREMRKLWMTDTNKDKQKIKIQPNPHTEPQTKDNPKHKTFIISY